jgi:general secretion pathway protein F/type IV pilus assembly protein PilC
MSVFHYEVLDRAGNLQSGEIEAGSKGGAKAMLSQDGQQVVTLTEQVGKGGGKKKTKAKGEVLKQGKVVLKSSQLIQFTEELSDMLDAGLPLEKSLKAISNNSEVEKIRIVAESTHAQFSEGAALADSLAKSSDSFSPLYCNLVLAGEKSGTVAEILARQVIYLTALNELKSKMRTAMIYPAFLTVSAFAVVGLFAFVLVPRLELLMEATGSELPFFAQIFASLKEILVHHWWQMIAAAIILIVVASIFWQSPSGQSIKSSLLLKLPLIGGLYKGFFNLHFTQTLSNLIANGVKQPQALELCRGVTQNPILQKHLSKVIEGATRGKRLHYVLQESEVFDQALIDMTRVGEDTGNLSQSLEKASKRLDRNFNRDMERLTALIQPVITIIIAAIVGVMAYMMVSVVYDTINTIRDRQF